MANKIRKKQVTAQRVMQFAFAYMPPLTIGAAVENNVFNALGAGRKTVEQIGKKTGASIRGLRAIMNALVGLNLLKKDRQNKYSLTAESEAFLVSDKPGTMAGFYGMVRSQILPGWLQLSEAVRTGRPVTPLNRQQTGPDFFSTLVENIIPMSFPQAIALGKSLRIAKVRHPMRVLDVAAGSGIWGIALAQQSPYVRVTAQDWAAMIPITKRITQKFGVADRFDFIEGDVLGASFGNGYDIVTLGHILHTEGEKRSCKLLKKAFAALKSGGVIAIGEWIVNDQRTKPTRELMFAVSMLLHSEHGDTFSFNQIKTWLVAAGFRKVRKIPVPDQSPVILAAKP